MQNHTFICTVIVSANHNSIYDAQMLVRQRFNKLFEAVMPSTDNATDKKGITDVHGIAVNRMEQS